MAEVGSGLTPHSVSRVLDFGPTPGFERRVGQGDGGPEGFLEHFSWKHLLAGVLPSFISVIS